MKKTKVFYLVVVLAVSALLLSAANARAVSEEARRHMDRGQAAVEMAKAPEDYAPAIKEFEQAIRLAPTWPAPYYSLGLAQEKAGKFREAVTSFKQYLRLAPNASDAATVKSLINKLEFKAEQEITKEVALDIYGSLSDSTKWRFVGEWSAATRLSGFRRDGDRIWLTYYSEGIKRTKSAVLESNTLSLEYLLTFYNWCNDPYCDIHGEYIFKIVSKNKVQVEAVEIFPKVGNRGGGTVHNTSEYIRIQ